jgi:hypothetical protein
MSPQWRRRIIAVDLVIIVFGLSYIAYRLFS